MIAHIQVADAALDIRRSAQRDPRSQRESASGLNLAILSPRAKGGELPSRCWNLSELQTLQRARPGGGRGPARVGASLVLARDAPAASYAPIVH